MPVILEGIVTTLNSDGSANISPMGPVFDGESSQFVLRPFRTSTTYKNLLRTGQGVFHITDDVLILAQAAIGRLDPPPPTRYADAVEGVILEDACRWYAFRAEPAPHEHQRAEFLARIVAQGTQREFIGFNRAKHAVLEAAILATRVDILPAAEIAAEFARLATPVEKTGGAREKQAFEQLKIFVLDERRG